MSNTLCLRRASCRAVHARNTPAPTTSTSYVLCFDTFFQLQPLQQSLTRRAAVRQTIHGSSIVTHRISCGKHFRQSASRCTMPNLPFSRRFACTQFGNKQFLQDSQLFYLAHLLSAATRDRNRKNRKITNRKMTPPLRATRATQAQRPLILSFTAP